MAPWGLSFGLGMHACIGQDLAAGVDPMGQPIDDDHLFGLVPVAIRALLDAGGRPDPSDPPTLDPDSSSGLLGHLSGGVPDVIDLHAHVVLDATLGAAGPYGPDLDEGDEAAGRLPCYRVGDYELVGVRYRGSAFMDVDVRLGRMDELGIDLQVLSPNPLTFLHHVDGDTAVAFSRRHNDALGALVAQHPDRLGGFAQLPMQAPSEAVVELRRAVSGLGLLGAYIGTDLGRPLDDPAFDEVYETCVELDVPLFIHPRPGASTRRGGTSASPGSMPTCGSGSPTRRRSPSPRWCWAGSSGATRPSTCASRTAAAPRAGCSSGCAMLRPPGRGPGPSSASRARSMPSLARLWWDAHVGGPGALAALVAALGTDHLVGGTNFAGWDQTADPSFGDASLAATLDANARRLLRRER